MALTGERLANPERGEDVEFGIKSRAQYVKALNILWNMESSKQGAKGIALNISNRHPSDRMAQFDSGDFANSSASKPTITIFAPSFDAWKRGDHGDLAGAAQTIRHELTHFQQWKKGQAGQGRNERDPHHGQDFRDIQRQFGGGPDVRRDLPFQGLPPMGPFKPSPNPFSLPTPQRGFGA